jgi:hypothetical protein
VCFSYIVIEDSVHYEFIIMSVEFEAGILCDHRPY